MGFWSSAWEGVKKFGGAVARVAKAAWDIATGPTTKSVYNDLEKIIDNHESRRSSEIQIVQSPNFLSRASENRINATLSDHEEKIELLNKELKYTKIFMAVQTEFSRLRNSAELIDRSMANVKIHASSLLTHYQNMRNINGLTDDVNALRGGLKHIMRTFNHNINVLSENSDRTQLKKIEGVDVDLKNGAVSQVSAFDSFDRTRQLLSDEINDLSKLANTHSTDLQKLRKHALALENDLGHQIIRFIDNNIKPVIDKARQGSSYLQEEIEHLPTAARDTQGKLVFEDGKLVIHNDNNV